MDGADCCAVYIDDRVKSERWVRRNSSDSAASTANSFILADEPEALQGNVELLLEVCKQSTCDPFRPVLLSSRSPFHL